MIQMVWRQLRRRGGRTIALLVGIVVATTSFTVLTGTASAAKLQVNGTVSSNFRSAYDVLVRPTGSRTAVEATSGLVRNNFLSGIFGGITSQQYSTISNIPGVEVAAPIAMVGYVMPRIYVPLDLTSHLSGTGRDLFRVTPVWKSDRGLTTIPDPPSYVYSTAQPLKSAPRLGAPILEQAAGGRSVAVCGVPSIQPASGPFTAAERREIDCWSTMNGYDGSGSGLGGIPSGHVGLPLSWPFSMVIAGIDPVQEAKLAGLDKAVVSGRYLRATDAPISGAAADGAQAVPVLAATRTYQDLSVEARVQRLPDPAAARASSGLSATQLASRLDRISGTPVADVHVSAAQAYAVELAQLTGHGDARYFDGIDGYWTTGPTRYGQPKPGLLVPQPQGNPPSIYSSQFQGTGYVRAPATAKDRGFRTQSEHEAQLCSGTCQTRTFPIVRTVGTFDPAKLPGFSPLSAVPLETYSPPSATGADPSSRRLLGGQPLLPNGDPAGYLAQPPLLLTTLGGIAPFLSAQKYDNPDAAAAISSVRIRVAGVTGPDAVSRERVRQVAQQISVRTGLDVDITVGSSPTPVTVDLPAGAYGRPALALSEGWTKRGVAIAILQAVDRKSVLLFGLILMVCALFVANAAAASVRGRRVELGVLAALGWRPRQVLAALLGELALLGLIAGTVGSLIAVPLSSVVGIHPSLVRAGLAVPAAVALAVLAGLVPVLRAARSRPIDAVRAVPASARRGLAPRTVPGLAATNLAQLPARTALGATAVAVGVAGLTLILSIVIGFRGVVVGTLLGDAVALQIRGVDTIAVAVTLLLGALSVADLLYLNVRERAAEFATLRATGWPERSLAALVTWEGALIGLLGSLTGAAIGLGIAAAVVHALPALDVAVAAGAVLAGTVLAALAARIPAALLGRLPTAALLADE